MDAVAAPGSRPTHPLRALGVLGVFALVSAPVLLGVAKCPTVMMFHKPCPGCGMTRAVQMLAHGDVVGSLSMHPFAVPALVLQLALVLAMVVATYMHGSPVRLWRSRFARAVTWALGVVAVLSLALWLARFAGAFGGPVPVW